METTTRAALYSRVSTTAQDTGDKTSLIEQCAAMEVYCESNDLTIAGRFVDVGSGINRDRPQFRLMQAGAVRGDFDAIVAWSSDRLARSGGCMSDLLDATEPHRVSIQTVSGVFDKRYAELLASIARMERQSILERTSQGKTGAARQGRVPVGKPPLGFRRGDDGKPEIVEAEAKAVRRMFELYVGGRMGGPSIQTTLKREHGIRISLAHVYEMLRNAAYVGRLAFEDIVIPCEPIVSESLFAAAGKILDTKRQINARNTRRTYLVSGIVTCSACGRLVSPRTKGGIKYYRCRSYTPACRPRPYIRGDVLEPMVWNHVRAVIARPDLIVERFRVPDVLDEDIRAAEADVQRWTRKNDRLISLFVADDITRPEFDLQRKYVQEPYEAAVERLETLRDRKTASDDVGDRMAAFKAACGTFMDAVGIDPETGVPTPDGGTLDDEGRKALIASIVESAVLDADNRLRYQLRVPDGPPRKVSTVSTVSDRGRGPAGPAGRTRPLPL